MVLLMANIKVFKPTANKYSSVETTQVPTIVNGLEPFFVGGSADSGTTSVDFYTVPDNMVFYLYTFSLTSKWDAGAGLNDTAQLKVKGSSIMAQIWLNNASDHAEIVYPLSEPLIFYAGTVFTVVASAVANHRVRAQLQGILRPLNIKA